MEDKLSCSLQACHSPNISVFSLTLKQSEPPSLWRLCRVHGWLPYSGDWPHHEAIWESARSHLFRTKDTPVTQEIPKDWGQRPNMRAKDALGTPSLQK